MMAGNDETNAVELVVPGSNGELNRQDKECSPTEENELVAEDIVSVRTKFSYGAPGFATTSLSFLISVYANDFYVAVGASLSFISFFTALARSFDVITDPVMGWFSDNFTSHPMGRRRPFILLGAPFYGILFFLLFSPTLLIDRKTYDSPFEYPVVNITNSTELDLAWKTARSRTEIILQDECDAGSPAIAYWFGFFYSVFYLFDTITNVPYESLGPELSNNYDERSRIFFVAKVFNFLGMMFAAGAPASGAAWYRNNFKTFENIPCDFFYNPHADTSLASLNMNKHGSFHPHQLIYNDSGVTRLAEYCVNGKGDFCFKMKLFGAGGGKTYYFEQDQREIDNNCQYHWCSYFTGNNTQIIDHAYFDADDREHALFTYAQLSCQLSSLPEGTVSPYGLYADAKVEFRRYSMPSIEAQIIAYQAVAGIFSIYFVIAMLNLVLSVKERPPPKTREKNIPLVASILRAFKNKAFSPLLAAWALDGLALAALVSVFPFYIRYVIKPAGPNAPPIPNSLTWLIKTHKLPPEWCMGLSVVSLFIVAISSAPFWLWLSTKKGKYKAWLCYNAANAITNILFLVPGDGDWGLAILVMALNGFPVGGQFLPLSILADVIDYDEFLNGSRSEGSFSVFATLIPKFVSIPASALPLAVIYMLGFRAPVDGVDQEQSTGVTTFIRICFIFLPFVCVCLAFWIKTSFPIKTKQMADQIRHGIKLHKDGEEAEDPLTGKETKLLKYDKNEAYLVWIFELFPANDLEILMGNRNCSHIIKRLKKHLMMGGALMTILVVLVGVFFKDLCDPTLSMIPILSIIGFGVCLCFVLVNGSRLKDAYRLDALYEEKINTAHSLLESVVQQKVRGQRAGTCLSIGHRMSKSIKLVVNRFKSRSVGGDLETVSLYNNPTGMNNSTQVSSDSNRNINGSQEERPLPVASSSPSGAAYGEI